MFYIVSLVFQNIIIKYIEQKLVLLKTALKKIILPICPKVLFDSSLKRFMQTLESM